MVGSGIFESIRFVQTSEGIRTNPDSSSRHARIHSVRWVGNSVRENSLATVQGTDSVFYLYLQTRMRRPG